jgi:hypothetical protein
LILGGIIVAFVVAMVVVWPGEKEPEYQGRKLSEWLGTYKPASTDPEMRQLPMLLNGMLVWDRRGHSVQEVVAAVRHMGTNGVRLLVKWVGYEPPKWRLFLSRQSSRLPPSVRETRLCGWLFQGHDYRAMAAEMTLAELGRKSLPMDELEHIAANQKTPCAAARVRRLFGEIRMRESFPPAVRTVSTNEVKGIHYVLKPELLPERVSPFGPLPGGRTEVLTNGVSGGDH